MKIKEIISQSRRDFRAIYICEGCGYEEEGRGYDDTYFHHSVIPAMKCKACGKTGAEIGADYRPLTTKYPDGIDV